MTTTFTKKKKSIKDIVYKRQKSFTPLVFLKYLVEELFLNFINKVYSKITLFINK